MKIWMVITMIALAAASAGCSDLQARGDMPSVMAGNAGIATPVYNAGVAGTLDPNAARGFLPLFASQLGRYRDVATVNLLAYWFDANKTVYCSPGAYACIQDLALDARANANGAATAPAADVVKQATAQAKAIIDVDNLRKAVK